MKIRCTRTVMKQISRLTLALGLTVAATGCGGYYGSYANGVGYSSYSSGSSNYDLTNTGTISAVRVDSTGNLTQTLTIKANSRLRVKITPGKNDKNITGTGYTYAYSKFNISLRVGNTVLASGDLRNGISGAAESVVMDFSSALSSTSSCVKAIGATCRNDVVITLQNPQYDFCQFSYQGYGCAMNTPAASHPWNVRVAVETDDSVGSL